MEDAERLRQSWGDANFRAYRARIAGER